MIEERHPVSMRFIISLVSYIALLQVLYAFQNILVSIPSVAIIAILYIFILQRPIDSSKTILDSTGSNTKGYATHERDLENLLVQQTEEVLQTNLQNFRKVIN